MSQRALSSREKLFQTALIAIALVYLPIGFIKPILAPDSKDTVVQFMMKGIPFLYALGVVLACGWLFYISSQIKGQNSLFSPPAGTILITSVRFCLSLSDVEPFLSLIIRLTTSVVVTVILYWMAKSRLFHYKGLWTLDRVAVMIASGFGGSDGNP